MLCSILIEIGGLPALVVLMAGDRAGYWRRCRGEVQVIRLEAQFYRIVAVYASRMRCF